MQRYTRSIAELWQFWQPNAKGALHRRDELERKGALGTVAAGQRHARTIFPIEDMYLLLEHGNPKEARFYPVGHMGYTPDTNATIIRWLAGELLA